MQTAKPVPDSGNHAGKFTGRHMLILMVLFFGVIISVNVTMATLASRSWTGLVVKNSYVASQKFNAELAAARRQHNRGWQSSLNYKNGVIQFALRESNGQPLLLENLMMEYGRPAFEQADRTASLVHVGNGIYRAPIALKAGVWALKITGGPADQLYRRDSRLLVGIDGVSGREE